MEVYLSALGFALGLCLFGEGVRLVFPFFRRYKIPRSLLAGTVALALGPQLLGVWHGSFAEKYFLAPWQELALFFVNVVFACVFLGKPLLSLKKVFKLAIPQSCFGQTLAWGQYAIGSLLTGLVLVPFFQLSPTAASLIEVSFQGGIGVAVGMGPTFEKVGAENLKAIAVGLSPLAMLAGLLSGLWLINRRGERNPSASVQNQKKKKGQKNDAMLGDSVLLHSAFVAAAVSLGYGAHYLASFLEKRFFIGELYSQQVVDYIPVFPLALIGGALIQFLVQLSFKTPLLSRRRIEDLQSGALDLVITMAIGNIALDILQNSAAAFALIFVSGLFWNLSIFLLLHKRLFRQYGFERGIADYGQSMGTTSIGLLLLKASDPDNKSKGNESFGVKQLLFEPFLGGGVITALSPLIISQLGLMSFGCVALFLCLFFLGVGFWFRKSSAVEH